MFLRTIYKYRLFSFIKAASNPKISFYIMNSHRMQLVKLAESVELEDEKLVMVL